MPPMTDYEALLCVIHSLIVWSDENDELIPFVSLYWNGFESYG
jgi:hypothetical protein